jgi:hypothetical protein
MKRTVIMLFATMALALGAVAAEAASPGPGSWGSPSMAPAPHAVIAGTITSVNASAGTFTASAYLVAGDRGDEGMQNAMPTAAPVTITTGTGTTFDVNGSSGTINSLMAGQRFWAVFSGSPAEGLTTLTSGTAVAVYAFTPPTPSSCVAGTITSVNTSAGTFGANAFLLPFCRRHWVQFPHPAPLPFQIISPFQLGGSGPKWKPGVVSGSNQQIAFASDARSRFTPPTPTAVTITVGGSTKLTVKGSPNATISSLMTGQHFIAVFAGSPTEGLTMLTASPALSIFAWPAPTAPATVYGFLGTVAGTSTANDTVTVNVSMSIPSGLVPSGSSAQTFTLNGATHVITGSGGVSTLSAVSVGDTVVGGLLAPSGETLAQIEATPLQLLLDFTSTATMSPAAKVKALDRVVEALRHDRGKHTRTHGARGRKRHHR